MILNYGVFIANSLNSQYYIPKIIKDGEWKYGIPKIYKDNEWKIAITEEIKNYFITSDNEIFYDSNNEPFLANTIT